MLVSTAVVAFVLHSVWEASHVGLYVGYAGLDTFGLPLTLWATLGDVLYTVGAYLLVALIKGDLAWAARFGWRDGAALALIGGTIALLVEYKALALHSWAYASAMPIIPYLHVGLSPVLQMTIVLPLSVIFGARLASAIHGGR
jgi:hypothetical protein